MVLNNFKKILWGSAYSEQQNNISVRLYDGSISGCSSSGNTTGCLGRGFSFIWGKPESFTEDGQFGLFLGTGAGEVTENDYCLFELYSDYESVSGSIKNCYDTNNVDSNDIFVITKTIKNTSDTAITITELGLCLSMYAYHTSSYTLLTHDLLDNPVTLEPDDVYTFTLRVKL